MAIRFIENFGGISSHTMLDRKWGFSSGTSYFEIEEGGGRNGKNSMYPYVGGAYQPKVIDNQATWIVGFAFKWNAGNAGTIVGFLDNAINASASVQCYLTISVDGTLNFVRGHTATPVLIESSAAGVIVANNWHYIEVKVTIGDSGSYEVHVDDTDVLSGTGDIQNTAHAYANTIEFGSCGSAGSGATEGAAARTTYYGEIYILDGTGTANNDFLDSPRVETYLVTGAGSTTQWTPSAGSNYENVDEVPPTDDTNYNSSSTAGNIDLFNYDNITNNPDVIYGVMSHACVRRTDDAVRTVREKCKSGETTYDGTTKLVPSQYLYNTEIREKDPATNAAWTKSGFNAAEFGLELVS